MFKPCKRDSRQSKNLQKTHIPALSVGTEFMCQAPVPAVQCRDRWRNYCDRRITIGLMAILASFSLVKPSRIQAAEPVVMPPSPSWQSWLELFSKRNEPRDKGPGGTAGPRPINQSCVLTPTQQGKLWNTKPLLIWSGGTAAEIGLRPANSPTLLWRQTTPAIATTGVNRLRYTGQPLQPGQPYEVLFFFASFSSQPQFWQSFQVMTPAERAPITADLQALTAQLQARNAQPETVALARANYFAQRSLWADALQEVYAVKTPSAELQRVTQTIQKQICSSQSVP